MLERFLPRTEFGSYEDFYENYKVEIPENFNFAFDVMDALAEEKGGELALLWCDENGAEASFTYLQLKEAANRYANVLKSRGIGRGTKVMLILKRRYQYWFAILALHKLGAVVIPATHLLTAKDIVYRVKAAGIEGIISTDDADVMESIDAAHAKILEEDGTSTLRLKAFITSVRKGAEAEAAPAGAPAALRKLLAAAKEKITATTGSVSPPEAGGSCATKRSGVSGGLPPLYQEAVNQQAEYGWLDIDAVAALASCEFARPEDAPRNDDIMLIYFTSGTTGMPKMVQHSWTYPLGHIVTAKYWHCDRPGGLHLTVADTGWAKAAWGKIYGQWLCECAVFVYDYGKFVPKNMLDVISRYKVTVFCAPPTVYRFFIKEDLSKYDFRALERCCTAGEPLNPEVFEKFKEATGLELVEAFGQTELTVVTCNFPWFKRQPGSVGKPAPFYELDILHEDGSPCKPGEKGQLVVRTNNKTPVGIFSGYYHETDRTARVWKDGIYWTGDVAWKDEEGYYRFVGRSDDVIKSSGYRIGPFEVESALLEHPAVLECAVTGVPDPDRGAVVKATIVLAKGFQALDSLKKDIQNYVKKVTAPYKYPRLIEFVRELPKTISGKIRRVEIRQADQRENSGSTGTGSVTLHPAAPPARKDGGVVMAEPPPRRVPA